MFFSEQWLIQRTSEKQNETILPSVNWNLFHTLTTKISCFCNIPMLLLLQEEPVFWLCNITIGKRHTAVLTLKYQHVVQLYHILQNAMPDAFETINCRVRFWKATWHQCVTETVWVFFTNRHTCATYRYADSKILFHKNQEEVRRCVCVCEKCETWFMSPTLVSVSHCHLETENNAFPTGRAENLRGKDIVRTPTPWTVIFCFACGPNKQGNPHGTAQFKRDTAVKHSSFFKHKIHKDKYTDEAALALYRQEATVQSAEEVEMTKSLNSGVKMNCYTSTLYTFMNAHLLIWFFC